METTEEKKKTKEKSTQPCRLITDEI